MDQRTTGSTQAGSTQTGSTQAGIVNTVKDRATAQLSTQKGRATEGLDVLASAVRQTTQQLRSDQHDTIAEYVDRAAEQLEKFSASIRNKDVNDLMRDATQFARRQPALFIGGSFVVGMLAARFLKSSRQDGMESAAGGYPSSMPRYGAADYQTPLTERF